MSNQEWQPENYKKSAAFVAELGIPVIELLKPSSGERVLDIGCGDGTLTKSLIEMGCSVVAVDASSDMVDAARAAGVDARAADAEKLEAAFPDDSGKFDAVMSNAALHWMDDQYAVVRGVWKLLRPGGRFACECGGEGCVRIIREGIKIALARLGVDYKSRNPWKFPEVGLFAKMLENQGFRVSSIARVDRPTHLADGLRGWLTVFANSHTKGFTPEQMDSFFGDVEAYCKPKLYNEASGWTADYVRLRFLAEKPGEV